MHRRETFDLADPAWDEAEARWMAALAEGGDASHGAWEALFDAYDDLFRRHLRALRLPHERIDEGVQQLWVELPRDARLYEGRGPVRSFLRNMLWHKATRYFRERDRERRHDSVDDEQAQAAVHEALFRLVPAWRGDPRWPAFRECVRVGFAAFSDAHAWLAELLVRHHVEGWSVEETAERAGSQADKVKEDLRRARTEAHRFVAGCLRWWPTWPGR